MSHLGHRLSALIDGELDGVERDRVLVHLARCEPCRSEAVALRTLKRRMNALGEAAADSALTRRLIGLAQPGSPAGGASPGAAPWSRRARRLTGRAAHGARELRPAWYVTFGATAVVLVGVGTAAFLAGGGADQPGPRVTPAVDTYMMQHDLMIGGVAPATSARYGPRPAATPSQSFSPPSAVSYRMVSGWRIAGLAAILGLLGSGVAGLALADVQPGRRPSGSPHRQRRPLRLAGARPRPGRAPAPASACGCCNRPPSPARAPPTAVSRSCCGGARAGRARRSSRYGISPAA